MVESPKTSRTRNAPLKNEKAMLDGCGCNVKHGDRSVTAGIALFLLEDGLPTVLAVTCLMAGLGHLRKAVLF